MKYNFKWIMYLLNTVIIVILINLSSTILAEDNEAEALQIEAENPLDANMQLEQITEEESKVLESLYLMEQELSALQKEEVVIVEGIANYKEEISVIENSIDEMTIRYTNNKENLKSVLRAYQKLGVSSFFETLFQSESLTDFISRLGIIRNLAKDTDDLLAEIEENEIQLREKKSELVSALEVLEKEQAELKNVIDDKSIVIEDKEGYLTSLVEKREDYENYLRQIDEDWSELKSIFNSATTGFTMLAETGALAEDDVELNISFAGVKGRILEETFMRVMEENDELPNLVIEFDEGTTRVSIEDKELILVGNFVVIDGNVLRFVAKEGTFYNMELTESTISELFEEEYLEMKIESLLNGHEVIDVESKDGYMELNIKLNLFGMMGVKYDRS